VTLSPTPRTLLAHRPLGKMAGLPGECTAERDGWHWAAVYFGDCVRNDRDVASFVLGLASIAAWGTAELPQIWAGKGRYITTSEYSMWSVGVRY